MKLQINISSIIVLLLASSIAAGLITTDFFYAPTSFAYYSFCLVTFSIVIIFSFCYLKKRTSIFLKKPIVFFGIWVLYIFFKFLNNEATSLFVFYILALYFLLISLTSLFSLQRFSLKAFFYAVIIFSSLESIYCILQYLEIFRSHSDLFFVTGSYNNPNVTAIFLALTTPVFLSFFDSKYKRTIQFCFFIMLIALLLLKCRAAFIGMVISTIVFYALEYNFMNWAKNKKNKTTVRALIVLSIIIVIPLCFYLYNAKKESSEGRKFIWKVSADLAMQKPFFGYGYGYFEKEYNLHQANYIQQGRATNEELKNAGPVIMPHNEPLHHLIQGGLVGLILMCCFFGILVFSKKEQLVNGITKKNVPKNANRYFNVSYAGVVAFVGVSMINSTIGIVSIMALLIIYAAVIANVSAPLKSSLFPNLFRNNTLSVLFRTTTIVTSLYVLCIISVTAMADRKNKIVDILQKEKHFKKALQIMPCLEHTLDEDPNYWKNYAQLYFNEKNYQQAIACFIEAKKRSSLPDLYIGSGICYEKLQQYPEAIAEYKQLVLFLPSKFAYRFRLMEAYLKNKDTLNTIITAKEILSLEPKIPSAKVERYKKATWSLLKKIQSKKNIRQNVKRDH